MDDFICTILLWWPLGNMVKILLLIDQKKWKHSPLYTLFKINKMINTITGKWQFSTFSWIIFLKLHIHKYTEPLPTSNILVYVVKVFWNSKVFINFIFFEPKFSFGPRFYCKYIIYKENRETFLRIENTIINTSNIIIFFFVTSITFRSINIRSMLYFQK